MDTLKEETTSRSNSYQHYPSVNAVGGVPKSNSNRVSRITDGRLPTRTDSRQGQGGAVIQTEGGILRGPLHEIRSGHSSVLNRMTRSGIML